MRNNGLSDAQSVRVTDTLPAGLTISNIDSGSWTCNGAGTIVCTLATLAANSTAPDIRIDVNVDPALAGVITNTASVSSNTLDPDGGDNTDSEATTITSSANIQLAKTDNGASTTPGGTVSYNLTVTNNGPSTAKNVVITETVPANTAYSGSGWTCAPSNGAGSTCTLALGDIAPGASQPANFQVTVDAFVPASMTEVANSALAGGTNTNVSPDSDTTPLIVAPGVAIAKTDAVASTVPGEIVTYTIYYTNTGNVELVNLTLTEPVPNYTTFAGPAGWSTAPSAQAPAAPARA